MKIAAVDVVVTSPDRNFVTFRHGALTNEVAYLACTRLKDGTGHDW